MAIDAQHEVVQDTSLGGLQLLDVVSGAGHDDEVGDLLQRGLCSVRVQKPLQVLAPHRPGQSENHRLVRLGQEVIDLP